MGCVKQLCPSILQHLEIQVKQILIQCLLCARHCSQCYLCTIHLIFKKSLRGRCYKYPHLPHKETEAQWLNTSPVATVLLTTRVKVWTYVIWYKSRCFISTQFWLSMNVSIFISYQAYFTLKQVVVSFQCSFNVHK